MSSGSLEPARAVSLQELLTPQEGAIASRVLARTAGGNVTLFAFDAGEELSEHSTPHDAIVVLLDGRLDLTIGGQHVHAEAGTITRLPADVPHAVAAVEPSRMLLIMLRAAV
jgi:quercetin dioxygenase-like cupin family protein